MCIGGPFAGCEADHPSRLALRLKMDAALFPLPHMSVAARSKTWVCWRWFSGIVGLNPARGMDDCLVCLFCGQVDVSASG